MSKSTGEFLTVSLLESKGYDPMVYRLFCLQSHYRKNLVFSYENMDNAKTSYNKLISRIAALKDGGEVDEAAFAELKKDFTSAMDNDLNTSLAVTALYNVLKAKCSDATKLALLADFDRVLSLNLIKAADAVRRAEADKAADAALAAAAAHAGDPEAEEIEAMIAARAEAKKQKNYAEADRIRAALTERGITLTDTAQGTVWERA